MKVFMQVRLHHTTFNKTIEVYNFDSVIEEIKHKIRNGYRGRSIISKT